MPAPGETIGLVGSLFHQSATQLYIYDYRMFI